MNLNNYTVKSSMFASFLVVSGIIGIFFYYQYKEIIGIFSILIIMISPLLLIEGIRLIARQEFNKMYSALHNSKSVEGK